jgi:hypothetical protein
MDEEDEQSQTQHDQALYSAAATGNKVSRWPQSRCGTPL